MIIFDEVKYAYEIVIGKRGDELSMGKQAYYIARYCYHELKMDDDDTYAMILNWMSYHNADFYEPSHAALIVNQMQAGKKRPLYKVDEIHISSTELEKIKALKNAKQERILFTLLCWAKYQAKAFGMKDGLVRYEMGPLFQSSCVSIRGKDRAYFLHDLYAQGVIGIPKRIDTPCLYVKIIDDADTAMTVSEIECQTTGFLWMQYVHDEEFQQCQNCGRLMHADKRHRYCKQCLDMGGFSLYYNRQWWGRMITCADCGKPVLVNDPKDKITIRCEQCTQEARRKQHRECVRRSRESKDSV